MPGEKGYVGIVTEKLRRSVSSRKDGGGDPAYLVYIDGVEYAAKVAEWSERKYGMNYMAIAVALYGEYIQRRMEQTYAKLITANNAGTVFTYKNPFR